MEQELSWALANLWVYTRRQPQTRGFIQQFRSAEEMLTVKSGLWKHFIEVEDAKSIKAGSDIRV